MKKLFKQPLFYTNLLLLALVVLLGMNTPQVNAKVVSWTKRALAAGPIFGSGNLNFLTSFASSNEIGDSQIFDDGTNVGIGTQIPGAKLDVAGSMSIGTPSSFPSNASLRFAANQTESSSMLGQISFWNQNAAEEGGRIEGALGNGPDTGELRFYTNPSPGGIAERMRIDKRGNVGIGTTDPGAKLEIRRDGTTDSMLLLRRHLGTPTSFSQGTDGALVINNASLNVLTLKAGNVGIGTTGPTQKFHLVNADTVNNIGAMLIDQQDPDTGAVLSLQAAGTSIHSFQQGGAAGAGGGLYTISKSGVAKVQLNSGGDSHFNGGNVGIGTPSPGRALDVRTSAGVTALFKGTANNAEVRIESTNGNNSSLYLGDQTNTNISLDAFGIAIAPYNKGKLEINGVMILVPQTVDPSGLTNGMMWMRQ